jgi:outer membrane protein TolC
MALRYNLGEIEIGENARSARGERLRALSALLPQVNAGGTETVEQFSTATLGIRVPLIPTVVGPFSFSEAAASLTQNLFSLPAIQRFRAARSAEQAAQLNYQDTLDVITLIVGNAYLQVIEANSRIGAAEAQVRNAQALYNQALDQLQAGTSPKIDVTRSGVQLHTEQYNLSITRNNFAIAKLNLARAIGLPLGLCRPKSADGRSSAQRRLQIAQRLPRGTRFVEVRPAAAVRCPRRAVSCPGRRRRLWHPGAELWPASWRFHLPGSG